MPTPPILRQVESSRVFFDPWINPDYYYAILPTLPLLFDKTFVYYPSDRWIREREGFDEHNRTLYRNELLYWIEEGAIVPVSKGDWPNNSKDIPDRRNAEQGCSDDFLQNLKNARQFRPENWLGLARDFTEAGRELAHGHIRNLGGPQLVADNLKVSLSDGGVSPHLARHYSKARGSTLESQVLETVATYENDDLIRKLTGIGHFLTPDDIGYQYAGYHKLKAISNSTWLVQTSSLITPTRHFLRTPTAVWFDRASISAWRESGLHHVLRDFLDVQFSIDSNESVDRAVSDATNYLISLRKGHIPALAASIDASFSKIIVSLLSIAAGVVADPGGAGIAEIPKIILGHVGKVVVRQALRSGPWDRLIDSLEMRTTPSLAQHARGTALALGSATIFGESPLSAG